jgi:NAD(P)-dependent dehydrogenase (short-subunit alcohol dehydrogenase family)
MAVSNPFRAGAIPAAHGRGRPAHTIRAMSRLDGIRALVTGGTSGIGAAIVERLAADGARVVFTGRNHERGAAAAERMGSTFVAADATDEASVRGSIDQAVESLGGLDALVCNAGLILDASILDTPLQDWQAMLDVNVTGAYLYSVGCLPALRDAGGGAIVYLASDAGQWGEQVNAAYSVTKAAQIALAQMLSYEAGPHGIRVNAVCPGDIEPGMASTTRGRVDREDARELWRLPPLRRVGQATEVAGLVAYLIGPDSSFVNGAAITIDGGMRAAYRAWEAG